MISSPNRLAVSGALALIVGLATAPLRADAGEATRLIAQSEAALGDGHVSAARQLANRAVAADGASAAAHLIAARTALAEGDGISAEAELNRARDAGYDMKRAHQYLAHARLLQGDAKGALALAKTTDTAGAVYGLRIQARALAALGNPGAAQDLFTQAIAQAPDDSILWSDIGQFRVAIGDQAGAIEAATKAVTLDGDNLDALLLRAQLVRAQFGLTAALPWYEGALKRDPYSYDVLIDYAATLGDAGRATDMLAATRRALAVRPGDARGFYLLAVLAARADNRDLARAMLERVGDGLAGVPGALLLGATLDIGAGDNEQAAAKLRNLVALQPMNIRARQLLGLALLKLDAARDALDVLRPIALRDDADSYSLTLAARAFERIGDRVQASALLDRAAHPGRGASTIFGADDSLAVVAAAAGGDPAAEPTTAIPMIRSLFDAGNPGGALARAQAVAQGNPNAPQAALVLGDTLMLMDRVGEAATAYKRAATLAFDEPTMLRLTEALERSGDGTGAADALALFLSQNPDNVAALRLSAHWQIAAGEFDAAIDTLEGLRARLGNRDAALLAELAYAYDGAKQAATAASFAAAAYRLAPSNAAAADAYGWALYTSGDYDGSLQLLQKAVGLAPDHAVLRWHIAQLYAQLNRPAEARFHAAAALRDPRFGDRDAAQALIAGLA
ncbi:MAG: tetratricopeptide repeat protein [Pseudomonadota bacterium]